MTEREQKKIISSEIQIEEPDDFVVTQMLDINSSLPADSPQNRKMLIIEGCNAQRQEANRTGDLLANNNFSDS